MSSEPVTATVFRRPDPKSTTGEKRWVAEFVKRGKTVALKLADTDPWNFDLENGLPVTVEVHSTGRRCKVISRLRNNKRYVKI